MIKKACDTHQKTVIYQFKIILNSIYSVIGLANFTCLFGYADVSIFFKIKCRGGINKFEKMTSDSRFVAVRHNYT